MKRTLSLVLALIFVLSVSLAFAEGDVFETKYFTMPLPDGWTFDNSDLEVPDEGEDLGYCYASESPGLLIEGYMIPYEDLQNVSLWKSDAEELQAYIDATVEDFAEDNAVYLDTVMADAIPFIILRCADEEGEYLYADTMTNGVAIEFLAYNTDEQGNAYKITDEDIELFKSILAGFTPVTGS